MDYKVYHCLLFCDIVQPSSHLFRKSGSVLQFRDWLLPCAWTAACVRCENRSKYSQNHQQVIVHGARPTRTQRARPSGDPTSSNACRPETWFRAPRAVAGWQMEWHAYSFSVDLNQGRCCFPLHELKRYCVSIKGKQRKLLSPLDPVVCAHWSVCQDVPPSARHPRRT